MPTIANVPYHKLQWHKANFKAKDGTRISYHKAYICDINGNRLFLYKYPENYSFTLEMGGLRKQYKQITKLKHQYLDWETYQTSLVLIISEVCYGER